LLLLESCSDELLVQTIRATLPNQELAEKPVFRYMGIGAFHLVLLLALSKRWFNAEGSAIAGRLTTGLGTMAPAQAGRDLWSLAEFAALHPELRRAVAEETDFAAFERRLHSITAGRAFLDQWNGFLSRHGHHARGEVELINPRWSETPDVVLGLVRNYLEILAGNLNTPATHLTELGSQRMALEKECLSRLKNPIKRGIFRWLLGHAQRGVAIKENVKSESVRRLSQARLQLLELGRRLAQLGRCADPNDVFFLTVDELRFDFLFGSDAGLREIVATRRAEYARNQKLHPPPVVFGSCNPDEWQTEWVETAVDHLEGMPVSPGIATGRARVLLEIDPHDRVLAGEILVAPSTDPAWSPYFLTAAGIVIDLGGMLSHGSILAREYGLPAVTNVGSATRVIRTGDLVQVDGNRGLVHILERATPQ
jgi:pyruvate,water dikinase